MIEVSTIAWYLLERDGWTFGKAPFPANRKKPLEWFPVIQMNATMPGRHKIVVTRRLEMEYRFEAMYDEPHRVVVTGETSGAAMDLDKILEMVAEAGWTGRKESDDTIRIAPDAKGSPVIRGGSPGGGNFRFWVSLTSASEEGREAPGHYQTTEARALLLLRLAAEFRLIVPVFRLDEFRLEVGFSPPGPERSDHVHHALESLTAATQASRQEFAALSDSGVATAYLSFANPNTNQTK